MDESEVKRMELALQLRFAPITSVDAKARTAVVTWTTGQPVRRYDWRRERYFVEELSLAPGAIRLERLTSGKAPFLNSHSSWDLRDVIGVVERAWDEGGQKLAQVRFSKRDEVEPIFRDVEDGILTNISVGYRIHKMEMHAPTEINGDWRYVATDWEPYELSLVPIPADSGASVRGERAEDKRPAYPCEFITPAAAAGSTTTRNQETTMSKKDEQQGAPAANTDAGNETEEQRKMREANELAAKQRAEEASKAAAKAAADAEHQRGAEIRELVRKAGLEERVADELVKDRACTVDEAGKRIIDKLHEKQQASGAIRGVHGAMVVTDETDVRRAAIAEAIQHRAAPDRHKLTDRAREYRGMNLIEIGRECIERAGGRVRGLSRREIAVLALNLDRDLMSRTGMHSTSDFTNILASTVNRTLRAGYELYPRTFTRWARQATAPDFRQVARNQLSELSAFAKVAEGGEYKYLTMSDYAEKYALGKYGGIVAFTWESMINDDLSAFDRIPRMIGDEAAATESDVVYKIITDNAAMADSVALFHATHANLLGAAAITDVTLGLGRAAMRKQTGPKGRILNLTPEVLLVGPDKESEANKYTSSQFVAAKSVDINPAFNTSLEVVVEPRLTGNQWYLSAAPTRVDTVEYSGLEGEEGIFTETRQGFEVDGVQVKARMAFAAKAIDWRGMQKNPGA